MVASVGGSVSCSVHAVPSPARPALHVCLLNTGPRLSFPVLSALPVLTQPAQPVNSVPGEKPPQRKRMQFLVHLRLAMGSGKDTGTDSVPATVVLPPAVPRAVVLSAPQSHSCSYLCWLQYHHQEWTLFSLLDPHDHLYFRDWCRILAS